MKADAIAAKIIEDARAAAAKTLSDAGERAAALRKAAEEETDKKREESTAQTGRDCVQLRDRMLRMAELDQKKVLLFAKREVIDQAFEEALKKMQAMPPARKREYLRALLLEAAEGGEQVVCAPEDAGLFDAAFLERVSLDLQKSGRKPVSLSEKRRETGGGFLLARGGMEINCTFRAMLDEARPSLESSVADILFN